MHSRRAAAVLKHEILRHDQFVDYDLVADVQTLLGGVNFVLEGDGLCHPEVALDQTSVGVLPAVRVCSCKFSLDAVPVEGGADKVGGESANMVGDKDFHRGQSIGSKCRRDI